MHNSVGAISWFYESQRNSCVEMVKSFRTHNPNSSIVIISDGFVSDINKVCEEYNCELISYTKKHGYPASKSIDLPREYIRRFFTASFHIKEKFFINLESDCLVTKELKVKKDHESDILGYINPVWSYYFYDNHTIREKVLYDIFGYYKECGFGDGASQHGGTTLYFDRIVGGGGFIFRTDYARFVINNWNEYYNHFNEIGKILKVATDNLEQFFIYQDYLLSLSLPIHNHKYKFCEEYNNYIVHPYKNFYV